MRLFILLIFSTLLLVGCSETYFIESAEVISINRCAVKIEINDNQATFRANSVPICNAINAMDVGNKVDIEHYKDFSLKSIKLSEVGN